MHIPNIKNNIDTGIRKNFAVTLDGPVDTPKEAIATRQIREIDKQEREIADRYVSLDNTESDFDNRPGFVSVAEHFEEKGDRYKEVGRKGVSAVSLEFDPRTGDLRTMSRRVETAIDYSGLEKDEQVVSRSQVTWDGNGNLTALEEYRAIDVVDSASWLATSVNLEQTEDGHLRYSENIKEQYYL